MADIRVSFVLKGLPDGKMAQGKVLGALDDPLTALLNEFATKHGVKFGEIVTGVVKGARPAAALAPAPVAEVSRHPTRHAAE